MSSPYEPLQTNITSISRHAIQYYYVYAWCLSQFSEIYYSINRNFVFPFIIGIMVFISVYVFFVSNLVILFCNYVK